MNQAGPFHRHNAKEYIGHVGDSRCPVCHPVTLEDDASVFYGGLDSSPDTSPSIDTPSDTFGGFDGGNTGGGGAGGDF